MSVVAAPPHKPAQKVAENLERSHRLWTGKLGIERTAGEPVEAACSLCVHLGDLDIAIMRAYLSDAPQPLPVLVAVGPTTHLMEIIEKIEKREQFFRKLGWVRNARKPDEDLVTYHSRILTLPPVHDRGRRYLWRGPAYTERLVLASVDRDSFAVEDPFDGGRRPYPLTQLDLQQEVDRPGRPMLKCRFHFDTLFENNPGVNAAIAYFPSIDQLAYARPPITPISVSVTALS